MTTIDPKHLLGTLAIHTGDEDNPHHAHVTPIYETSTFAFPDVATGQAIWRGEQPGHIYTRLSNPNQQEAAVKIAVLEGIDLLREQNATTVEDHVSGALFASGMGAITATLLTLLKSGDTVIAQEALYGATFTFLKNLAPQYGIRVVWVQEPTPETWQQAFSSAPDAKVVYVETPSNPSMAIVDLHAAAEIAHQHGAWLLVDNTFATPYCQRPLTLGADVILHSTTKYIGGHGLVVGGAVVTRHPQWMKDDLAKMAIHLGASASPFDAWLVANGLKTFEIRMQRHCFNAMNVAQFLQSHPAVAKVNYPGLSTHPDYKTARAQMGHFGAMISFELKDGYDAGVHLLERVQLATLAVSLGTVDTLIQHPASMTHSKVSREDRLRQGVNDGLIRLSVGIENADDILADLDQALM